MTELEKQIERSEIMNLEEILRYELPVSHNKLLELLGDVKIEMADIERNEYENRIEDLEGDVSNLEVNVEDLEEKIERLEGELENVRDI